MKRPRVQVSLDHDVYEYIKDKAKTERKSVSYMLSSLAKKQAIHDEDMLDYLLIREAVDSGEKRLSWDEFWSEDV